MCISLKRSLPTLRRQRPTLQTHLAPLHPGHRGGALAQAEQHVAAGLEGFHLKQGRLCPVRSVRLHVRQGERHVRRPPLMVQVPAHTVCGTPICRCPIRR